MRNTFGIITCLGLLAASSTWALPTLQLDVPGGTYVGGQDETSYPTSSSFSVRALYNGSSLSTTFYLSAALEPMLDKSTPPPNVGTFKIDGTVYSASSLNWGSPPVDVLDGANGTGPGNLSPHGMFPTYYAEIAFKFNLNDKVGAYNTQDGTTSRGSLYYVDFDVDISGLLSGYSVHFDLYDEKVQQKKGKFSLTNTGGWTVDDFAPFSHDAQSLTSNGGEENPQVPDGGVTVALLGMALLGLGSLRNKFFRN